MLTQMFLLHTLALTPSTLHFFVQGGGGLYHKELQQSSEKLLWIHFPPTIYNINCP